MPVLTPGDLAFFEENGYVVAHNVVDKQHLDAVVDAIWEFLGMDADDPNDWYREPHRTNGMIEMYQHQALWDCRQSPRVHEAFADVWGTERLWVSFDRCSMKPPPHPAHPEYDSKGFIHWDTDTSRPHVARDKTLRLRGANPEDLPIPYGVQGVLYLTHTDIGQGGFQCVPELYRCLPEWIASQPADRNPKTPDLTGFEITPIPGNAGDLVIWDRLLPHGNGHNTSRKPRFAQYIGMSPAPAEPLSAEDAARRADRVRRWRERLPAAGDPFPGDPREWEQKHGQTAHLTELGRKLLGLEPWC